MTIELKGWKSQNNDTNNNNIKFLQSVGLDEPSHALFSRSCECFQREYILDVKISKYISEIEVELMVFNMDAYVVFFLNYIIIYWFYDLGCTKSISRYFYTK